MKKLEIKTRSEDYYLTEEKKLSEYPWGVEFICEAENSVIKYMIPWTNIDYIKEIISAP